MGTSPIAKSMGIRLSLYPLKNPTDRDVNGGGRRVFVAERAFVRKMKMFIEVVAVCKSENQTF
jgi:hypothetical protein